MAELDLDDDPTPYRLSKERPPRRRYRPMKGFRASSVRDPDEFDKPALKRFIGADLTTGVPLFALGLALYFLPVYLTKLWRDRYYPAMTLLGPPEDVINKSFPGLRSFLP